MKQPGQQRIEILHFSDVMRARSAAEGMARAIGFEDQASNQIVLVASELASNIVQHTKQGTMTLTPLNEGERVGIQIESLDSGPGIADVEQAMADGFSTTGSAGCGLGTVNRAMDEINITSPCGSGVGTHIVCKRWIRSDLRCRGLCPLDFGAAMRAHPKMGVSGDAFIIRSWSQGALVGVIDGLGHGRFAHKSAQKARQYVEDHLDRPLAEIFRNVGCACRGTRGVVMALARFDFGLCNGGFGGEASLSNKSSIINHQSSIRLTFGCIGNVEARVFGSPKPARFVAHRGILGGKALKPVVTEHSWDQSYVMVLHCDGLKTNWEWEDFSHLANKPATVIAQKLLHSLAKEDDDATVVVVKGQLTAAAEADLRAGHFGLED